VQRDIALTLNSFANQIGSSVVRLQAETALKESQNNFSDFI